MRVQSEVLRAARSEGRVVLTEVEAKALLEEAAFPVAEARLARTSAQAQATAREMGFPVVLKVCSPDITHKSDVGGVRLSLKSSQEVARAYREIIASAREKEPRAKLHGVAVQRMASPGIEVIMGMFKDAQFGPVLMFGLGGIFVEVLKDVSFRLVPLTPRDARQMIREIKGFPVLEGYRGQEPAHLPTLEEMLLKLSAFIEATPEIKEMDLNPIFAYKDGAVAVDARIILEPK